jgi:hypothetical protein
MLPAVKPPSRATRRRDYRVRQLMRRIKTLSPTLDNPLYGPQLTTYCRLTLMLHDTYERLQDKELVRDDDLHPGLDAVRRLALAQARLAESLGLTPGTNVALAQPVKPIFDLQSYRELANGKP